MTKHEYINSLKTEIKYRSIKNLDITSEKVKELCQKYNIKIKIARILSLERIKSVVMFSHFRFNKICINEYFLDILSKFTNQKIFGYYTKDQFFEYCIYHEISHIINKKNNLIYDIHGKEFFKIFSSLYNNIDKNEIIFYKRESDLYKFLFNKKFKELKAKNIQAKDFTFTRDMFKYKYSLHYKNKVIRDFILKEIFKKKNFISIVSKEIKKIENG